MDNIESVFILMGKKFCLDTNMIPPAVGNSGNSLCWVLGEFTKTSKCKHILYLTSLGECHFAIYGHLPLAKTQKIVV